MTFYAGDEYADDDCTSGPYDPELHDPDFDAEADHARAYAETLAANERLRRIHEAAERQAIEDEYDREQSR